MNLLARVKLSAGKGLFPVRTAIALHQLNFYYAKPAEICQETEKSTKLGAQKPYESSFSQGVRNQPAASTNWPKPREIPYQSKVVNFVNLVGHVKAPVRFEAAPDGKYFASIVISQESSDRKGSLSIPVVFDGDLAQIVAYHVKQNDGVLVSGRLSKEPLQISGIENFANFHVVADNLNFVEGFGRKLPPTKVEVSFSGVRIENPGNAVESKPEKSVGKKKNEEELWRDLPGNAVESKPEKSVGKKKNGEELWRDLVKLPHQWWDYRGHKSSRLVKDKYPDFKQKSTGDALWIDSAPAWALSELVKLEFDVKEVKGKSNKEDLCKSLVENPANWWDNRLDKHNPRAPDFKHKETGEGLWLRDLPDWALSRLPPSEDNDGKKNLRA